MIIVLLITFFIACICIGLDSGANNKLKKIGKIGTIVSIFALYVLGIIIINKWKNTIPAIEVYRGKTTLQITYEDNTPIDSVVVYKNK